MALVPAKDRADSVGETVAALRALPEVDTVVVIDDGSRDGTAALAARHGASVVRLERNVGKGGAVAAGIGAAPDAAVYLLVDADVRGTSALVRALLAPVLAGEADLTIGVLPSAGGRGGFGTVRELARRGIARGCGMQSRAPLSGQRAVRGDLLRSLRLADRFGLEVAMTIDAVRSGARLLEIDVAMEHRHTGRRLAGFRHRAGQGVDICRALWPRLTSRGLRVSLMALLFVIACAAALLGGSTSDAAVVPLPPGVTKVVLFGVPGLSWDELRAGSMPVLSEIVATGAVAATNVRTGQGSLDDAARGPASSQGYATLGAGVRVSEGKDTGHRASALGDALQRAGLRTAVVGEASAAVALADSRGHVDSVATGPGLREERGLPGTFAVREELAAAATAAMTAADVVLVDPGDLERHPRNEPAARAEALARTDAILADVHRALPAGGLLMVVSVVSPSAAGGAPGPRALTPTVAAGSRVPAGYLSSASTHRTGLVTLTDVAPTVLDALDVDVPREMIGQPLAVLTGPASVSALAAMDGDATYRQRIYLPLLVGYVVVQVVVYLLGALAVVLRRQGSTAPYAPRLRRHLGLAALAVAAYPVVTFVFRGVQLAGVRAPGIPLLLALTAAAALLAARARGGPLVGLSRLLAATIALLAADLSTGARLQASSLLGYALHTSSRYTGAGNTTFAILLCATVLLAALHVRRAPRGAEALVSVGFLFAFVLLVQGAPALGSDVGGIITMVPVFGLTLWMLAGRRVSVRALGAAVALTAVALVIAAGVDAARPAPDRTHLGRLVVDVQAEGLAPLWSTITRRVALNFGADSPVLSVVVLGLAGALLVAMRRTAAVRELLPGGSALRIGVAAALAGSVLGYLVNDSGVVVVAMSFVFVGPLLTVLALRPPAPVHVGAAP